ncbi:MAG: drug/metabolite transporter (DMT)-like permease [Paraglaciecola psychrophila]|jgi:drug/metabolite transporter (DMT)-like permease
MDKNCAHRSDLEPLYGRAAMLKQIGLTVLALFAFAGNSVLCRLALGDEVIDAASFTSIRLFSGTVFLLLLVVINTKKILPIKAGSWTPALLLFVYAMAFSYAYITLDTGIGALILFGAVQITMIGSDIVRGKKLLLVEWIGLLIAFVGLIVLLIPGTNAPTPEGFVLMAVAGIAWGFYTLAGRGSNTPLVDTCNNFLRTLPLMALATVLAFDHSQISNKGIVLAIVSGAVTSGLGYAVWYAALAGLTVTRAAVYQLAVQIIAAFGGVFFSNEIMTVRLISASILMLAGILLVIMGKQFVAEWARKKR